MANILSFDRPLRQLLPTKPFAEDETYSFWPEVACGGDQRPVDPANSRTRVFREIGPICAVVGVAVVAATFAAHADPLPAPATSASLRANGDPYGLDLDWAGKWYVGSALSGLARRGNRLGRPAFARRCPIDRAVAPAIGADDADRGQFDARGPCGAAFPSAGVAPSRSIRAMSSSNAARSRATLAWAAKMRCS